MNKKILGTAAVILIALAGGAAWALSIAFGPKAVTQPIAFNHKLHIKEDMACTDCHKTVETGQYASFPTVEACMLCHGEAQGENPEEPKVREYAEAGKEIPWVQVNRLEGHVYFYHAAHVKFAKMDCATCHGDMKERTEPVSMSQIRHLDMGECMSCHAKQGVSNDCLRCHK